MSVEFDNGSNSAEVVKAADREKKEYPLVVLNRNIRRFGENLYNFLLDPTDRIFISNHRISKNNLQGWYENLFDGLDEDNQYKVTEQARVNGLEIILGRKDISSFVDRFSRQDIEAFKDTNCLVSVIAALALICTDDFHAKNDFSNGFMHLGGLQSRSARDQIYIYSDGQGPPSEVYTLIGHQDTDILALRGLALLAEVTKDNLSLLERTIDEYSATMPHHFASPATGVALGLLELMEHLSHSQLREFKARGKHPEEGFIFPRLAVHLRKIIAHNIKRDPHKFGRITEISLIYLL